MRVLIISIYYKPEPVPKPHELAEGLARRGHAVTAITGFPNYPTGRFYPTYTARFLQVEQLNGVRVIRTPIYPDHSGHPLRRAVHYLSFSISALVFGLLFSRGTDVVYVWGNPPTSGLAGWLVSRLRGVPFVYGVHDLWPDLAIASGMVRDGFFARMIDALERFVLKRANVVIAISRGFQQRLLEKGLVDSLVHVIPHWADEDVYKPLPSSRALRSELGWNDRFVVLYAGNVGRIQGLENLLQAAAMLRDSHPSILVVLIGDGVERGTLSRLAAEQGLHNVQFLDPKPPSIIAEYSAAADALYVGLKTSSLAPLSVPSKVQTYLACGKPILCNVPGETSEIVAENAVGINCREDAPKEIADAITRLATIEESERIAMGIRARALFMRDFSMSSLLEKHETLFAQLGDAKIIAVEENP